MGIMKKVKCIICGDEIDIEDAYESSENIDWRGKNYKCEYCYALCAECGYEIMENEREMYFNDDGEEICGNCWEDIQFDKEYERK